MSGAIKINGTSSGSTTITAPASGGDESIELSTVLAAKLDASAGQILQVVSTTKTDVFTTTSTSMTDLTGLSASITPTSASSKVLVIVSVSLNPRANASGAYQIVRGSTAIAIADAAGSRGQTTGSFFIRDLYGAGAVGSHHLDSPATTSATTYKVQVVAISGTLGVNSTGGDGDAYSDMRTVSTITLMEVSA